MENDKINFETYYASWGRDYSLGSLVRYEYTIFKGEKVVARGGCFKTSSAAKRAGIKAAEALAHAQ